VVIWYILSSFSVFGGHLVYSAVIVEYFEVILVYFVVILVYFVVIWYILWSSGILSEHLVIYLYNNYHTN
jgi:hypothetical protein